MLFGQRLLMFRAKYRLTQTDAANILGVTLNMVHRYETGASNPSAANRIRFEGMIEEWEAKQ